MSSFNFGFFHVVAMRYFGEGCVSVFEKKKGVLSSGGRGRGMERRGKLQVYMHAGFRVTKFVICSLQKMISPDTNFPSAIIKLNINHWILPYLILNLWNQIPYLIKKLNSLTQSKTVLLDLNRDI